MADRKGTKATLGGVELLGSSPIRWTSQPGVVPSTADFDVRPSVLGQLLGAGEVDLVIESREGNVTIAKLTVLHEVAGPNQRIKRVRVADRRWKWDRNHVLRRYNIRRHVGNKRVPTPGAIPAAFPVVPEIQYAPWSLDGGKPWTASRVLQDLLEEAIGEAVDVQLAGIDGLPIENLQIDDNGAQALARVLGYLPEAQVAVDNDGSVRVYSRAAGGEEQALTAMSEVADAGTAIRMLQGNVRPSAVHVLFTREHELRVDVEEIEIGATTARGKEDIFAENVLPIPDFQLAVNGQTLPTGTWITVNQALAAWGALPGGLGGLTQAKLRQLMVPYMDLWAGVAEAAQLDPSADWAARIATLEEHWRKTYRINRRVTDRVFRYNAYRLATIDPTTGTRGKAIAWADYAVVGTQRILAGAVKAGLAEAPYAQNVSGYPPGGLIEAGGLKAPATVELLDNDQGIIRLDWVMDENRLNEMVLPGKVENNPTYKLSLGSLLAFNVIFDRDGMSKVPQLAGSWKAILLLSCVPAAPNSDAQLHRITVRPQDVAQLLPPTLRGGLLDARGPELEVRIGPGTETARVAWVDSRRADIERALGIQQGTPNLDGLIINAGQQDRVGTVGASLDAIAAAAAARVYAEYSDRWQGARVTGPNPDARIEGFIDAILHQVDRRGAVTTTIESGSQAPRIDMGSFLRADVRAILYRLAQPGKAA